jgi:hypothetical protein
MASSPVNHPQSTGFDSCSAIVIDRHYTVLSELNPGSHLLIITAEWTDTPQTTPQRWPRRSEVAPTARHWRTLIEKPDEEPDFRSYTQLYAKARPWQSDTLDILLRAVADDKINGVLLGPPDLGWLYHPYDGDADVILPTRAERDELKARHHTWLSDHPVGRQGHRTDRVRAPSSLTTGQASIRVPSRLDLGP